LRPIVKRVLYLHGFASSPRGRKVTLLSEILEPEGIRVVAPDLNVPSFQRLDFKAMARIALWEARIHRPAVLVGSSLGALVALEGSREGVPAPLVLIAPALGFGPRWMDKLPPGEAITFFHHGEEKDLPIHRFFFEELAHLGVDREPPPQPVTIVIGRKDESVPYELVRGTWERWEASGMLAAGSRFVEISEGDHGLVDSVALIADEIRAAAAG
jgi:pimeloyl-ACP methyl ester carboxylesterase